MAEERPGPLRILLLAAAMDPRQGGPPRVVYGSACALARAGHQVEIATTGDPEEAVSVGHRALDEVGRLRSRQAIDDVQELRRIAASRSRNTGVADLRCENTERP